MYLELTDPTNKSDLVQTASCYANPILLKLGASFPDVTLAQKEEVTTCKDVSTATRTGLPQQCVVLCVT